MMNILQVLKLSEIIKLLPLAELGVEAGYHYIWFGFGVILGLFIAGLIGVLLFRKQQRAANQQLHMTHVSEYKRVESELKSLMKILEAKKNELQSVIYTVSHDLKSPLVNIKGFSGVLSEASDDLQTLLKSEVTYGEFRARAEKLFNDDVQESVEFIVSNTDKMNFLLDGLLAVSRVGSSEIYIDRLDMAECLQSVLKTMQYQLDENHVEIEIGTLPDCIGDAAQVGRVFMNLIDNALKYRNLDHKCVLQISGKVDNGKSVYRVEDNGIGISDNHLCKIFDLFHRLDPNDGIEGQGIGLTIAKRILQRQNGDIRVESEHGKGTAFFIELPARQSELADLPTSRPDRFLSMIADKKRADSVKTADSQS